VGTWGAGIFSNDIAADVRDEYRLLLEDGLDGASATEKLLAEFADSQDDIDDGPALWLSLAATQYRLGRLEDQVRSRALQIIDDGSDLAHFKEDAKLMRAREKIIFKLRDQLVGPQHQPVRIRARARSKCDWEPGEIVGFQRSSGEWIPLHVQGVGESRRSRYPIVCVLALPFERIEDANDGSPVRPILTGGRARRPTITTAEEDAFRFGSYPDYFAIVGMRKRDMASNRIKRTHKHVAARVRIEREGFLTGSSVVPWKIFDDFLDRKLGA
jgi:hypothetical protein